MSDLDVQGYLRSKNLDVRTSGKEVVVACFFLCGESGDSRKKKLYVSSEHGCFQCKVCGAEGGWRGILEHFGDEESASVFRPSRRLLINAEYVQKCQDALMANERALTYLFERGFTSETIEAARLGFHPKGVGIVETLPSSLKPGGFTRDELRESGLLTAGGRDFHVGRLIIPYLVSGQVVQIRGRALDKNAAIKYATPAGDPVRLYGSDDLRGADAVLVVEGEFDRLMMKQTLEASPDVRARNIAVVAMPGAQVFPGGKEGFPQFFEDCRRVYLGFDNDSAGKAGAIKGKDMLGSKARIVELTKANDWNEFISEGAGWRDVMDLVAEADMRGKRVFSVEESARSLYAIEQGKPGIKTGFATLDALIRPGLLPGGVTTVLAKTGTGKSILLANIAYYTRDIPAMFITLEMTKAETYNRLRRITRFHDPTLDERGIWDKYPLLGLVDQNRLAPDDFSILMEEFAEERGERPQLVFVDYLGYYARGMRGKDMYERNTNAVMQLKEVSKEHEVHTIVPSQVNRVMKEGDPITLESGRDSGAIEETSDFMFGIYRPHMAVRDSAQPGSVASDLMANILKSRHGNAGRVARLALSYASLAIVDASDRVAVNRIEQENAAINRGESYADILARAKSRAWTEKQGSLISGRDKASGE